MVSAAIQLYTLRDVDLPFDELLGRVADAGFDGVEFAYRVTEHEPADVTAALEENDLSVAGAHVPIEDLEDDREETLAFYEALGCEDVVVPWLDGEFFESEDGVAEAAERIEALNAAVADRGLDLHYHNHDHEFVPLNGATGFDAFVDATDVGIELDLGLALLGGDDPVARLEALGDRAPLVHVKDVDVDAGESVPVGEGDLNVAACAERVRANDGEWLIYEYEGADPLASLDDAADAILQHC